MNIVDGSLFNRLLYPGYVHSNPDNFLEQTTTELKIGSEKSAIEIEDLKQFQKDLAALICRVTQKCNEFYKLFDIYAEDTIIYKKDGNIAADFEGAKEFEKKFLLGGVSPNDPKKESKKRNTTGIVNEIIATKDYQQEVIKRLNTEKKYIRFKGDEIGNALVEYIDQQNGKADAAMQEAMIMIKDKGEKVIQKEVVDILFQKTSKSENRVFTLNSQKFLEKFFENKKDLSKLLGFKKNIFTSNSEMKKFKKHLIKYYDNKVFNIDAVIDVMWEVLIEKAEKIGTKKIVNSLKETGKNNMRDNFKDSVRKSFGELLKIDEDRTVISIEEGDIKLNGANFEQSINLAFQFAIKFYGLKNISNNISVKVIGQEKNNDGQQIGSDLVVEANGKEYLIQAKNSFSQKDWGSIHLQSTILVDTFARNVFGDNATDKLKTFEYVFFNRAYLEKCGMTYLWDENGKGEIVPSHLDSSNDEEFMRIVNYFLNQAMLYLISGKVLSMGDNDQINYAKDNINKGNLFFIYRQRYLIPISIFLFSSYVFITKIILAAESKDPNAIEAFHVGKLTYQKNLLTTGVRFGDAWAKGKYEEKIEAGNNYYAKYKQQGYRDNDYVNNYPPPVMEIGQGIFEMYQKYAKFPRLNFNNLSMKKLNQYLDLL